MIFRDIPIGTEILYKGHYAKKTKPNEIQIPRLGTNGFLHIDNEQEIEVIDAKQKKPTD